MRLFLLTCVAASLSVTAGCGSSVAPTSVAGVSISPSSVDLVAGSLEQKQLEAITTGVGGSVLPGRAVAWSSSDKTVASVSADGIVKGIAQGKATITATSEGKSGTAVVNVAPMTDSLTGVWFSKSVGPLSDLRVQLYEANTETVTGDWSGYAADCTPLNSAQCLRTGTVLSGYRHGSSAQFVLAPASPCGFLDATVMAMFARSDSLAVLITRHNCNAADATPVNASLKRQ